jgi:hypothetical protein
VRGSGCVCLFDEGPEGGSLWTMPRASRVDYPGAIYHVMDRGDRQEDIFVDGVDQQDFLKTLAEACRKTDWRRSSGLRRGCTLARPKARRPCSMNWPIATTNANRPAPPNDARNSNSNLRLTPFRKSAVSRASPLRIQWIGPATVTKARLTAAHTITPRPSCPLPSFPPPAA